MSALVQVRDLAKVFDVSAPWLNRVVERKPRQWVHAVDGVSFAIERGTTLALVGDVTTTTIGRSAVTRRRTQPPRTSRGLSSTTSVSGQSV